jgi:RimJ/RimL family protein N-acetyltransferase
MSLYFRTAVDDDCDLMFKWANDYETRKNAFNPDTIEYSHHVKWYKKLNLNNVLIFYDENKSDLGLVRIDLYDNSWIITTMVDKSHRNKGIGTKMLSMAIQEFFDRNPTVKELVAYIKESNLPSMKAFSKANFSLKAVVNYKGFMCYKMVAKLPY